MVAFAVEVPITILHTTDLHAQIWPTTDYDGNQNVGGVARVATKVAEIRANTPNVLLVDAGDTIQGSAVGFLTDGQVMMKYLNYMKYDAWVLGNHEWDWGADKLDACVKSVKIPIVTANVKYGGERKDIGGTASDRIATACHPYRIIESAGVKVGIVGITTPGIPNWSRPHLIPGMQFESSVDALRRVIPEMKSKGAEILVLVTHQGWRESGDDHANQLNAVTREFPELDVIIGGHSHRHFPEHKLKGILYTQANYWGTYLGRVDFVYDTAAKKLVSRKATTIPMDATVEYDKKLLRELSDDLDRTKAVNSEIVGEAAEDFLPTDGGRRETAIHNLIGESIRAALKKRGIEVVGVFHGLLDEKASLPKGEIAVRDVWRIVPYENTLGVADLAAAELREIMEESAALWQRQQFRGLMGFKVKLKASGPVGERVVSLADAEGKPLDASRRYSIAFNSFDLASAGTRFKKLRELCERPASNLREVDVQTRTAVVDYIRERKTVVPEVRGWWEPGGGR